MLVARINRVPIDRRVEMIVLRVRWYRKHIASPCDLQEVIAPCKP
jgi:hypothetical protein